MVVINMRTKSKRLDARGQRIESARCWTKTPLIKVNTYANLCMHI